MTRAAAAPPTYFPYTMGVRPLAIPSWPLGVSLDAAMRVPAFRRGVELKAGTIATFPLAEYMGSMPVPARALLKQPEPDRPYAATIRDLVVDLDTCGRGYWYVLTRDADGWPRSVRYMPAAEVQELSLDLITFRGETYADVIRFHYGRGSLFDGAETLSLAIDLESAAARYAASPLPSFALKNQGADLPAEEVQDLLTAWEDARQNRSTAYLNSTIDTQTFGWNSQELQLVDARNQAAIEIARILNLDPTWVGAGIPGSSMTYQNRTDLYRQLLDMTLAPLMDAIVQRLSYSRPRWAQDIPGYPAVTEESRRVSFDTDRFLASNYSDRITQSIALFQAGLINQTEARALLDLSPLEGNL